MKMPEPVAWLRSDGMKSMPADEKDAWIKSGNQEIVEDYTAPLYTADAIRDVLEQAAQAAEAFHRHKYDFTGNMELHEFIRAMKEQIK